MRCQYYSVSSFYSSWDEEDWQKFQTLINSDKMIFEYAIVITSHYLKKEWELHHCKGKIFLITYRPYNTWTFMRKLILFSIVDLFSNRIYSFRFKSIVRNIRTYKSMSKLESVISLDCMLRNNTKHTVDRDWYTFVGISKLRLVNANFQLYNIFEQNDELRHWSYWTLHP